MVKLKNTKRDVNFPRTDKKTWREDSNTTHTLTHSLSPHLNMLQKVAGSGQSWWSSAEGKCFMEQDQLRVYSPKQNKTKSIKLIKCSLSHICTNPTKNINHNPHRVTETKLQLSPVNAHPDRSQGDTEVPSDCATSLRLVFVPRLKRAASFGNESD